MTSSDDTEFDPEVGSSLTRASRDSTWWELSRVVECASAWRARDSTGE